MAENDRSQSGSRASTHDIVGVYGDPEMARGLVQRIIDLGVPASAVRLDDAAGRVESLKAEMRDEADNTFVGPGNFGPFTKEMSKGIVRQVLGWAIGLAVLALPLGIPTWGIAGDVTLGVRLVIAALVGAATGVTIGFVVGGGRGAGQEGGGYSRPLAAERGVTLAVTTTDAIAPDVVRVMREAQPIRLDIGSVEGNPIDTITTEDDAARHR